MTHYQSVTAAAFLALAVMGTPVNPAVSADSALPGKLGVGFSVDSRWIAVEGYYSPRDRGAGAREQAWAGETPSRGASSAPGRTDAEAAPRVRVVRIAAVPNVVGRTHHNFVVMRALGQAAFAVARHVVGAVITGSDPANNGYHGDQDADRR
jgi:hypothetical protein